MRLNRILLYVKDLPRAAAFYRDIIGLTALEKMRTDTYVEFDAGAVTLALHAIPAGTADKIEIATPPQPREQNPIKLAFEVDDVARERKRLASHGVTMLERPWGACDGVDPEGNIFGLYTPGELT